MNRWFAVRAGVLALCLLVLAGCATQPDLVRLYEGVSDDPNQPPVILIHGLAGSTLVDAETGKQFFPGSLGTLTFSNYADLAQMSSEDREGEGLVPGALFESVAGVDFYGEMLHALETVGHFQKGVPGQRVVGDRTDNSIIVQIESAVFKDGNKWRLTDGGNSFYAEITDQNFIGRVQSGQERFGKSDILVVDLQRQQLIVGDKLRTDYTVVKVHEHRAPLQSNFELGS